MRPFSAPALYLDGRVRQMAFQIRFWGLMNDYFHKLPFAYSYSLLLPCTQICSQWAPGTSGWECFRPNSLKEKQGEKSSPVPGQCRTGQGDKSSASKVASPGPSFRGRVRCRAAGDQDVRPVWFLMPSYLFGLLPCLSEPLDTTITLLISKLQHRSHVPHSRLFLTSCSCWNVLPLLSDSGVLHCTAL